MQKTIKQVNSPSQQASAKQSPLTLQYQNQPHQPPKKGFKGRGLLLGIGIGVIIALAGTKLFSSPQSTSNSSPSPSTTAAVSPAKTVTAATVKNAPVNRTLKATGTVAPYESVSVLAQATGLQIRQIMVDEGDFVKAGQVLAVLDDASQKAQLMQAQATVVEAEARLAELQAGSRFQEIARAKENINRIKAEITQAKSDLDLARKRVNRNQSLQAEGAIAQDRLDEFLNDERNKQAMLQQVQARLGEAQQELALLEAGPRPEAIAQAAAQLAAAKASFQSARTALNNTRVISPANGKVFRRNARVGQTTTSFSDTPLFEIIENGRLELQLKIPETELTAIRPGQAVEIASDADKNLKLRGTVREINPLIDEESRQGTVKVNLPKSTGLKPGMFLRGEIITETVSNLTVPMAAILPQRDGSSIAYVLQADGRVKAQSVEMGAILPNQQVEVKSGLQPGQQVIIKGAAYLKDGEQVSLVSDR